MDQQFYHYKVSLFIYVNTSILKPIMSDISLLG